MIIMSSTGDDDGPIIPERNKKNLYSALKDMCDQLLDQISAEKENSFKNCLCLFIFMPTICSALKNLPCKAN